MKASDYINENQTFIAYNSYNNNTYYEKIPRTPSANSNYKFNFPPKKFEEKNINDNYGHEFLEEMNYNKTERNSSPKGFDKKSFKNLVITKSKNKNEIEYNKSFDIFDENCGNNIQQNINGAFGLIRNEDKKKNTTPRLMRITKIYANLNKDKIYNNNISVSINGTKENKGKNYIKNINIQQDTKTINLKENENIKTNRGIIPKEYNKQKDNKILVSLKKKKKTTSQGIKLLESNNIKKLIGQNNNSSKNKTVVVLYKNKKIQINDEDYINVKTTKKPKKKSYEEENNYKKEIEKIEGSRNLCDDMFSLNGTL